MDKAKVLEIMEAKIPEILQDAAFLFLMPLEDWEIEAGEWILASLDFSATESGTLFFCAPEEMGLEVAGTLADGEVSTEHANDVIGELLNILGGSLVATWFGADSGYDLKTPQIDSLEDDAVEALIEGAALRVIFEAEDEYPVFFWVTF